MTVEGRERAGYNGRGVRWLDRMKPVWGAVGLGVAERGVYCHVAQGLNRTGMSWI